MADGHDALNNGGFAQHWNNAMDQIHHYSQHVVAWSVGFLVGEATTIAMGPAVLTPVGLGIVQMATIAAQEHTYNAMTEIDNWMYQSDKNFPASWGVDFIGKSNTGNGNSNYTFDVRGVTVVYKSGGVNASSVDLTGNAGNNALVGTHLNDWLHGMNGNDRLEGGHGRDLLFGGNGNDKLFGGSGNDKLYDGAGSDFLNSGNGADTIYFAEDKNRDTASVHGNDEVRGFDMSRFTWEEHTDAYRKSVAHGLGPIDRYETYLESVTDADGDTLVFEANDFERGVANLTPWMIHNMLDEMLI